jgi:hypothetical protein
LSLKHDNQGIDIVESLKMTTRNAGGHTGSTELTFTTSLGTPVEGLWYRLSDGLGNTWTGLTGKSGKGVTIVEAEPDENPSSSTAWTLASEASIRLEVQRDDGSWKTIGSFLHSTGSHRRATVIAGAIAMSFQMASA